MKNTILIISITLVAVGAALCIGGNQAGGYLIGMAITGLTFISCLPKKTVKSNTFIPKI